jgi:hypothetical protein
MSPQEQENIDEKTLQKVWKLLGQKDWDTMTAEEKQEAVILGDVPSRGEAGEVDEQRNYGCSEGRRSEGG